MSAYYNENDPFAARWLRSLIKRGLIADGEVDERSIADVRPDDVRGFTQCHWFAGIGGWSYALRLAGWPDDCECWTGSCPCQPFSVANVAYGGKKGKADERHLLPDFLRLIGEHHPPSIFGEQVPHAIQLGWLDELFDGLEVFDYACGARVDEAYSVAADHERSRVYWVADAMREGRQGYQPVKRIPFSAQASCAIDGDPLIRARRALGGDYGDLLPRDGVSIQLERCTSRGYGNAIVPQVAAEFIRSYMETLEHALSQV